MKTTEICRPERLSNKTALIIVVHEMGIATSFAPPPLLDRSSPGAPRADARGGLDPQRARSSSLFTRKNGFEGFKRSKPFRRRRPSLGSIYHGSGLTGIAGQV